MFPDLTIWSQTGSSYFFTDKFDRLDFCLQNYSKSCQDADQRITCSICKSAGRRLAKDQKAINMGTTLYDYPRSGHAHRVRLFLHLLGVEHDTVTIDMAAGEHKTSDYMKLSPLGQVPTLVDDDVVITDSTAAIIYLAKKYGDSSWLPEDPAGAASIQRWLSAASGELYRGPVLARAGRLFGRDVDYARALQNQRGFSTGCRRSLIAERGLRRIT